MNSFSRRRILAGAAGAAGLSSLGVRAASSWPDKPIRLLVPFGAGGITDIVARATGDQLSEVLGQTVIVENKPGAGGNLAAETLKNAAPDGYTVMLTTIGVVSVNPHTYTSLRFDPLKDFVYISQVAETPHAVAVHPDVPVKSVRELVELAKAKPESLSFGTAGYGSSPHQGLEILQATTGTRFLHVPFRSGAESVRNVMGGQVSMTFEALPVVMPQAQAGKLKVLAIAAAARHASAPDLPTTGEQGYPALRSSSISGLIGPAGMPQEVVDKLNAAVNTAAQGTKFKARLYAQGTNALGSTPQAFVELVHGEYRRWEKLMAAAKKRQGT